MPIRIASWNINSIRIRIPAVRRLVKAASPDIVCLQETKVEDDLFPRQKLQKLGYEHIYISGQKGYNGMAILSRLPLSKVHTESFCGSPHKRHLMACLPGGIELHNFYVPAGADIPDPKVNPAFAFKLDFLDAMECWAKEQKKSKSIIAVGDWNVAPLEEDVWSHKQLLKVVSHTPPETERLERFRGALKWIDAVRHFAPEGKLFSWWSYRNQDWRKSDRGRRLDHIWVTPGLKNALVSASILKDARDWRNPSDHVPVLVDIDI